MNTARPSVAVIGGGISGLTAAYYLSKLDYFQVSLFEAKKQLGGHAFTFNHQGTGVDTAVVGFHLEAYPKFVKLIREIGVDDSTHHFKQDLCFHSDRGIEYLITYKFRSILANPQVLLRTLRGMQKFSRSIVRGVQDKKIDDLTLEEFLRSIPMSEHEIKFMILPMIHMFVGLPFAELRTMSARFMIDLLFYHKVLHHSSSKQWRAWNNGTITYVSKLQASIKGSVHVGVGVRQIEKQSDGTYKLTLTDGETASFDNVIIASPPGNALKMLKSPTALERRLLEPWKTGSLRMCIHQDTTVLPKQTNLSGFWNPYVNAEGTACGASYLMHKIHPGADPSLLVSWEPIQPIAPSKLIFSEAVEIARYTGEALKTHKELHLLNKQGRKIYYCGAHFGLGWHESGVVSGIDVVNQIMQDYMLNSSVA